MALSNTSGRGEFIQPGCAGGGAVEARLDAVAFVLNFGEVWVHFGYDAGYVEAADVWGVRVC